MSISSALQTLANYRSHNTRASQDILEKGEEVLKANAVVQLGDDGEQPDYKHVRWSLTRRISMGFSGTVDSGSYRCREVGYC
jgi:hypothetical protein